MAKGSDGGSWSPYLAGGLAGLLAIVSVYATTLVMGKSAYFGTSTTFVRAAGMVEGTFAATHVSSNDYYKKEKIKMDWQFMFVIGIFAGALIGALTGKSFKFEAVPQTWSASFGSSIPKRALWAFLGGLIAMMGARMADGCPSGHGLSGLMQLSASGFLALIMFYGAGVVTAHFLYTGKGGGKKKGGSDDE